MIRNIFQAVQLEYAGQPTIDISVDGTAVLTTHTLPTHSTFRGRRLLLPATNSSGFLVHLESNSTQLQNERFEAVPIETFSQQQLFHYYEFGFRGLRLNPRIYLDSTTEQTQGYEINAQNETDTARVYFNSLAYGYIPHIFDVSASTEDNEILWARPVALPPRFYRGIRTHAEFQITYKGNIELEWFLDGNSIGTYTFNSFDTASSTDKTKTEKAYFPSGTIGHVLQYIHKNPELGGKVYMVETDVTLADLEQQGMRPQPEEG